MFDPTRTILRSTTVLVSAALVACSAPETHSSTDQSGPQRSERGEPGGLGSFGENPLELPREDFGDDGSLPPRSEPDAQEPLLAEQAPPHAEPEPPLESEAPPSAEAPAGGIDQRGSSCTAGSPALTCYTGIDFCRQKLVQSWCWQQGCGLWCGGQCVYTVCVDLTCVYEPWKPFNPDCL